MSDYRMLAGTVIDNGCIRLLKMIGSGGFGAVYHAEDVETGVQYAIKVVSKKENLNYRAEIKLHQMVGDHPNIVTLHGVFESSRFVYIVLEYQDGGDLFTAVETCIYAGQDELIKSAFNQIIDAVEYCHSKGVYHRDLKLENVLCSRDGSRTFLADFGLASNTATSEGFRHGSVLYMSPECLGVDSRAVYRHEQSDIWSLGIMLVILITGRPPWEYAAETDRNYQRFRNSPSSLRNMFPLSLSALDLICRILQPDPALRISLAELREEILKVDTFTMTLEELMKAPRNVQMRAVEYAPLSLPPSMGSLQRSSGSETDSDGPVTPETYPCLLDIDVPEISGGIGELMIHNVAEMDGKPKQSLELWATAYSVTDFYPDELQMLKMNIRRRAISLRNMSVLPDAPHLPLAWSTSVNLPGFLLVASI